MTRWYGDWAGDALGKRENADLCAYEVYPERGWIPRQCQRKRPPGQLVCKQHAKEAFPRIPKDEAAEETKERVRLSRAQTSNMLRPKP